MNVQGRALGMALAGVLAVVPTAAAQSNVQDPPKLPDSARGAKRCGSAKSPLGQSYRVYITKGKSRATCRAARSVIQHFHLFEHRPKGWTYFDWTKGGNGPWSDVWERHDEKVVVAAIIRA
jgi:hypothetical protein